MIFSDASGRTAQNEKDGTERCLLGVLLIRASRKPLTGPNRVTIRRLGFQYGFLQFEESRGRNGFDHIVSLNKPLARDRFEKFSKPRWRDCPWDRYMPKQRIRAVGRNEYTLAIRRELSDAGGRLEASPSMRKMF